MYYGNLSGGSSSGATETDKTLKKPGVAADAEATGKALEEKVTGKGIGFVINDFGGLDAIYDDKEV